MKEVTCRCGIKFKVKRGNEKFCSGKCRQEHHAERVRKQKGYKEHNKVCVVCGENFTTYRKQRVTCSVSCSESHNKTSRKTWYVPVSIQRASVTKSHQEQIAKKNQENLQAAKKDVQNVLDRYALKEKKWRVL